MERAGLRLVELETGHLVKGPRFATFHYRGRARDVTFAAGLRLSSFYH